MYPLCPSTSPSDSDEDERHLTAPDQLSVWTTPYRSQPPMHPSRSPPPSFPPAHPSCSDEDLVIIERGTYDARHPSQTSRTSSTPSPRAASPQEKNRDIDAPSGSVEGEQRPSGRAARRGRWWLDLPLRHPIVGLAQAARLASRSGGGGGPGTPPLYRTQFLPSPPLSPFQDDRTSDDHHPGAAPPPTRRSARGAVGTAVPVDSGVPTGEVIGMESAAAHAEGAPGGAEPWGECACGACGDEELPQSPSSSSSEFSLLGPISDDEDELVDEEDDDDEVKDQELIIIPVFGGRLIITPESRRATE